MIKEKLLKHPKFEKNKEKITIEKALYILIILCPILDILSFLFRNTLNTKISPSTILRPIIPIIVILYIFIKKHIKLKLLIVAIIYLIYSIIHLFCFSILKTNSSYSGILHELQYIINYSFIILNLFIYLYCFKNKNVDKLKKSILILSTIYILSIFISILTKTSSMTYIEAMGYKGWIESGNSLSSILILSLFVILNLIKIEKYRYWAISVIILIIIFLTTLIGTRVGLYGCILVLFIYAATEIFVAIIHKIQLNKFVLLGALSTIITIVIIVGIFGSTTLKRRQHLKDIEINIVDTSTNQEAHISGSLLEIKEKIDNNILPKDYMNEETKQAIQDLYKYANKYKLTNNDMRTQQFIYHANLVKNQANLLYIMFGNGYMTHYRELVFEMEIPAFLFNFGIIGFILYFVPFFAIFIYSLWMGFKNIKKIDTEYIMLLSGLFFCFVFGFLSGYTFFNTSTMLVVIVICVLLINKQEKMKKENIL